MSPLRLVVLATLTLGLALTMAAAFADRLIFLPPRPSYGDGMDSLVRFESATGDTIAARHIEAPGARLTVLFAHGNAEDIGHGAFHADRYAELGVSVLAFDYPGYGLSSGRPTEPGSYAAASAAYRYLTEAHGVEPSNIVAHGRSLGGAVAVDLAAREEVAGLVVESSFVSAYRVMTRYAISPVDQFTSLKKLDRVEAPVLVIHGDRDEVIAPWHGLRLLEAVPEERRQSLWVEGAGHNDLAAVAGERYWEAMADFMRLVS